MTTATYERLKRQLDADLGKLDADLAAAQALDDADARRLAGLRGRARLDQLLGRRESLRRNPYRPL
jgi:hypothetical protein